MGISKWERLAVALAVSLCALVTYVATLAPTVVGGDSGELITAAVTLGIPHPPGYPLYCLLAHLFTWLPIGSLAYRVNLFSAVAGAATAGLLAYLVALTAPFITPTPRRLFTVVASVTTGLIWAWAPTFWSQAIAAEVYTLHALFMTGYLVCLFQWAQESDPRWLYRSSFLVGLSLAHHHLTVVLLPTLLFQWLITAKTHPQFGPFRLALKSLGLLCLPLLIYLYLPIRSSMDPPIDWGHPNTLDTFLKHVFRWQYGGYKLAANLTALVDPHRLWNGSLLLGYASYLTREYSWLLLAVPFGVTLSLRRLRLALPMTFIWFFGSLFIWANIRSSASFHYLFDVFLATGEIVLMLWMGWGVLWVLERAGKTRVGIAALVLGLCLIPILSAISNWSQVSRRGDYIAYDFSSRVLDLLPPHAVYFVYGDTDISCAIYLRAVENRRPDVQLFDFNCGEIFKDTPILWGYHKNPNLNPVALRSIADFVRHSDRPVFIAFYHDVIQELKSELVPYGPLLHYDPKGPKAFSGSRFPWSQFKLRGRDKPCAISDRWNWLTLGNLVLGRVYEQYYSDGLETITPMAQMLLLDPKTWRASGGLSLLYASEGRLEEALSEQYRIVLDHPVDPAVYFNLGLLYLAAGNLSDAANLWRHALILDPNWATAQEALGALEYRQLQTPKRHPL